MDWLRTETASALDALRSVLPTLLARDGAADVRHKAPGDLVTATDLHVESTLQRILGERHPDIQFVGEEGAQQRPTHGRYWLVDPLCGTANYAADLPFYSTNLALVEDDRVTAAVVADGARGDLYVAERGRGAWRVAQGAEVRLRATDATGLLGLDPYLGPPGALKDFGRQFALRVIADGRFRFRVFASMLVLPYVASGRLAAAVFGSSAVPVHVAGGLLLAEEAGATLSDMHGQPWRLDSAAFVVSATERLHAQLLEMARQLGQ